MTQAMNKTDFCNCLETIRKYALWENELYKNGIDLGATPAADLAVKLQEAMCGFDLEWSYDKKLGFDWIVEWTFNKAEYAVQERHGREWFLEEAEALYDFLMFMDEHGWED